jgi:hypothetical protein
VSQGVAGANVMPCVEGDRVKEIEPRPEDAAIPAALALRPPRGPGCSSSREATLDDAIAIPGSSDVVDVATRVLGLPGYPRASLQPTSWKEVAGGVESTCSHIATMRRLLKETLVLVCRDVLLPARVSPRTESRGFSMTNQVVSSLV